MKIISWNVNGLQSIMRKFNFKQFLINENPDIVCLQETKCNPFDMHFDNYSMFCSSSTSKNGYAGTAILSKIPATKLNVPHIDDDGRVTAIEIENNLIIICIYSPNSQRKLEKLQMRIEWDSLFRTWIKSLEVNKKIIICGDFNVSYNELDIAEPKKHHRHPGFTDEERKSFELILTDFIDVYRHKNPLSQEYSFWSYLGKNYERNIGYRCDLFLIKKDMINCNFTIDMLKNIRYSDHCPVVLVINT